MVIGAYILILHIEFGRIGNFQFDFDLNFDKKKTLFICLAIGSFSLLRCDSLANISRQCVYYMRDAKRLQRRRFGICTGVSVLCVCGEHSCNVSYTHRSHSFNARNNCVIVLCIFAHLESGPLFGSMRNNVELNIYIYIYM